MPADWRERFIRAYDVEFQEWIDAVDHRRPTRARAPGTATPRRVVSDVALEAKSSGKRATVKLGDKPKLYAKSL